MARGGACDGGGLAGEELQVVGDASVDEGLDELDGVGHVNVVVAGALGDEDAAFEFGGVGDRGVGSVGVGVIRRQAKESFGVDGVVVAPVGDGGNGYAGTDAVGVGHGIESEVAPPAPAPATERLGGE